MTARFTALRRRGGRRANPLKATATGRMAGRGTIGEIEAAIAAAGWHVRTLEALRPPDPEKWGRALYRVALAGGRTIKVRLLETAGAAHALAELRTGLDPAFAPVLAQHDRLLLEAWVEGTVLTDATASPWIDAAAALLGRLHATTASTDPTAAALDPMPWRDAALADLATLARAGALPAVDAAHLEARLRDGVPGPAPAVIVHGDFCAENMVVDADGRLHVVDNEWIARAPAGFDLGRTSSRWAMTGTDRHRFRAAYRAAAGAEPPALPFWELAGTLKSARFRLRGDPARLAIPLGLLRTLARGFAGR